jgi:hypothetical protein
MFGITLYSGNRSIYRFSDNGAGIKTIPRASLMGELFRQPSGTSSGRIGGAA